MLRSFLHTGEDFIFISLCKIIIMTVYLELNSRKLFSALCEQNDTFIFFIFESTSHRKLIWMQIRSFSESIRTSSKIFFATSFYAKYLWALYLYCLSNTSSWWIICWLINYPSSSSSIEKKNTVNTVLCLHVRIFFLFSWQKAKPNEFVADHKVFTGFCGSDGTQIWLGLWF